MSSPSTVHWVCPLLLSHVGALMGPLLSPPLLALSSPHSQDPTLTLEKGFKATGGCLEVFSHNQWCCLHGHMDSRHRHILSSSSKVLVFKPNHGQCYLPGYLSVFHSPFLHPPLKQNHSYIASVQHISFHKNCCFFTCNQAWCSELTFKIIWSHPRFLPPCIPCPPLCQHLASTK